MTCENYGPRPLDYLPCRYGISRAQFRGPKADLSRPYALFLGGTETYGKFIPAPFPKLVEDQLGITAVNLGMVNAGPDLYLNDPEIRAMYRAACVTVIQAPTLANLSNRYYNVHPRRNDRFLTASNLLKTIYRDVDFSDFHFTGHLIQHLKSIDTDRFAVLMVELQEAWLARMSALIKTIAGPVILLSVMNDDAPVDALPAAVLEKLRPEVDALIHAHPSDRARDEGTARMVFTPIEASAAACQISQLGHEELARRLCPEIRPFLPDADLAAPQLAVK